MNHVIAASETPPLATFVLRHHVVNVNVFCFQPAIFGFFEFFNFAKPLNAAISRSVFEICACFSRIKENSYCVNRHVHPTAIGLFQNCCGSNGRPTIVRALTNVSTITHLD